MLVKNILKSTVGILAFIIYATTFGATPASFKVEVNPSSIKVGETTDITITALDKNGAVVKDYLGEILIFSQNDPKAEFPGVLSENTYKFKTSDAGKAKFENAVKFSKNGTQDINVYDVSNENVFGLSEIIVSDNTTNNGSGSNNKQDIKITNPQSGTTLGTKTVKLSGMGGKNYKFNVLVNNKKVTEVISNSEGLFEIDLTNLQDGENTIKVQMVDADGKINGESSDVFVKIESIGSKVNSFKITPDGIVSPETDLEIEINSTKDLTSVGILLNDMVDYLTQKTPGVYVGKIKAPKAEGTYDINVVLKNELGLENTEKAVKTLEVKKVELAAAPTEETPKVETEVKVNCDDFKTQLEIKNTKLVKLKTKSILTWDKVEKASSYNIYKKDESGEMVLVINSPDTKFEINIVGDVVKYEDFAVKAVFKDDVCNIESTNYSSMTKVQTGPKEIALIILAMFMSAIFFIYRRKQA